ncbi:MAG: glycine cleavage system aminomethyltransferase GcvT [Tenuifilaceae bacterium]|jgi:aminomethyltransferase|nr:glycine cleavage system aminomethyltransferase GcvT [Bacteroidales bacterium]MDI9516836.1 glycine cleavage system aminomethyltransferase GcvT [Bacteroidota bacterium]NLH55797.1 glycine cleavage system aminomethyltransferase GcvT [Rikenellaceae bacterium]OQC64665.1 MAG: Aminomethyltransferase [Bacteroidetes bacterium ADurb.Bin008]HNV81001.1 glycine cleavage system aminomethyltransferase GcvT [Tenuifilaceae bacterium]
MKQTPFTKFHIERGAKMAPFAGFNMPIEFSGINDEHITVREKLGVFDVSHMGEVWVKGPNALNFLQYVTSNDVSVLTDGKIQYTCFPNGKGGIVDDLLVYRFDAETYLLVINAGNTQKDWEWLCSHAPKFNLTPGKELYNASSEIAQLAVQGPLALKAMQKLTKEPIESMEYYTFKKIDFAGIKDIIFSITGYTGAGGCEIYCANEDAEKLWKAVFEAGAEFGIKPIGLGARDTLRLEMGYVLYGNDINESTSPLEAGLGWITKFVDHKNFIDKEYMLNLKTAGLKRKLVGFEMVDRGIPRQHYEIFDSQGNLIGEVTSGTMSPMMKIGVGMGYVGTEFSKPDTEIFIGVRDKKLKAKVVKLPIYKK